MESTTHKKAFKPQRDVMAKEIRRQRKLLEGLCSCSVCENKPEKPLSLTQRLSLTALTLVCLLYFLLCLQGCARASSPNWTDTQIANAIYTIEGGTHTRWPYGILHHYKHTTPRQACLNTIKHQRRLWASAGRPCEFTHWLAMRYAPIGAGNDPKGLNRNWERNLMAVLEAHG